MRWPSPAKLNLFLHIVGRRADGYHLLQTVFQLIDLCDELEFEARTDGKIRLTSQIADVAETDNLVWRAAALLQRTVTEVQGVAPGISITLHKRLPMGGGLGGGSSNAATALVALNSIWGAGLSRTQLAALGLQLGADVPVFVQGYTAWGEGVGENLQPLEMPAHWFVVVHPGVSVSTAELFSHSELTRDSSPITIAGFRAGEAVCNAFQNLVCRQQPQVASALKMLAECAAECGVTGSGGSQVFGSGFAIGNVAMTGTGSCIFLTCEDEQAARSVRRSVAKRASGSSGHCDNMCAYVARGLNQSPLNNTAASYRPQLSS